MQLLVALISGGLFGAGLVVSDMVNPGRVLAFLDVTGNWDPTLAFVMGGALAVMIVAWQFMARRDKTLAGLSFKMPSHGDVDARLVGGAALFGIGWGLVGLCPGPALTALVFSPMPVAIFVAAMIAGMVAFRLVAKT